MAKGSRKGMPIPIDIDLFMLGSDRICQIRSDRLPSRQCAFVTRAKERKVFLRDFDSGASTLVNGTAIPSGCEWPLFTGDRIEVGPLEFVIQFQEKHLAQKDLEEWAAHSLDAHAERDIFEEFEEREEAYAPTTASGAAAQLIGRLSAQRGVVMGRLRIAIENGITTVRFNDSNLVEESEIRFIKKELCEHLAKPNLRVLIDCKNIQRMSSSAILMLREFTLWLQPWGSTLALCRVRPDLQRALVGLNVDQFKLFADKKLALAGAW